jgi:gliding motility-associated-like protein
MYGLLKDIKYRFGVCSISFMMLLSLSLYGQQNQVISNIIRGSVVGLGWSHGGLPGQHDANLFFDCSDCNQIGNAYLLAVEYKSYQADSGEILPLSITLNDEIVSFTSETRFGTKKIAPQIEFYFHFKKIDFECNGTSSIEFSVNQESLHYGVIGYYLFFECLNNTSSYTAYNLVLNNSETNTNLIVTNTDPIELLPTDLNFDVGLALSGIYFNFMNGDASDVTFNGNYLGKIAGQDASSSTYQSSGVRGHFRYSNGMLIGMDDDTPDLVMNGTDALANVKTFMNGNSAYFSCEHENLTDPHYYLSNPAVVGILSYTPLCDTFSVSVPKDTAICYGSQLPLHVSGGVAYEWYPSTGLSCSDCPDPVFSSDSSMFYTVKIYNNDSCFVSRPLHVTVFPEIDMGNSATPSLCGTNTGEVVFSASSNSEYIYTLIGGETNYHGQFQDLGAGNHSFYIVDSHGCQSTDTVIFVPEVNLTQADFELSPGTGTAPLIVDVTNTSQAFTQFEWFLNGVSTGLMPHVVYDSTGVYEIELVVWQYDPVCADTAFHSLLVYDSLIVDIPNIFTPNSDGVNDFFEITINQPVKADIVILNRWGNSVFSYNGNLNAGENPLWFPENNSEGVYFYRINLLDLKTGSALAEKQGFVQISR